MNLTIRYGPMPPIEALCKNRLEGSSVINLHYSFRWFRFRKILV